MITFFVPGRPAAQGSKRAFVNKHTGKPIVTEMGGDRLRLWRHSVNDEARKAWKAEYMIGGPLSISIRFVLQQPKKIPKGMTHPIGRISGDLDKLCRAVFDGLTSIVFADDSQVVELRATKEWGEPIGAWIVIQGFHERTL